MCDECGYEHDEPENTLMSIVWVGGVEVNDYLLNEKQADYLADYWTRLGYDDVQIEKIN